MESQPKCAPNFINALIFGAKPIQNELRIKISLIDYIFLLLQSFQTFLEALIKAEQDGWTEKMAPRQQFLNGALPIVDLHKHAFANDQKQLSKSN